MSSPSLDDGERQLANLRTIAEIEIMLSQVENKSTETCKFLEEVLAKIDELTW